MIRRASPCEPGRWRGEAVSVVARSWRAETADADAADPAVGATGGVDALRRVTELRKRVRDPEGRATAPTRPSRPPRQMLGCSSSRPEASIGRRAMPIEHQTQTPTNTSQERRIVERHHRVLCLDGSARHRQPHDDADVRVAPAGGTQGRWRSRC